MMINLDSSLLEAFNQLDNLQEAVEEYKSKYVDSPSSVSKYDNISWNYNCSKYYTVAVTYNERADKVYWTSPEEIKHRSQYQMGPNYQKYMNEIIAGPYRLVDFDLFHKCWDYNLAPTGLLSIFKADGTFKHRGVYGAIKDVYFGKGYNKISNSDKESTAVRRLLELWEVVYKVIPTAPDVEVVYSVDDIHKIAARPECKEKITQFKAEYEKELAAQKKAAEESKRLNKEAEERAIAAEKARRIEAERREAEAHANLIAAQKASGDIRKFAGDKVVYYNPETDDLIQDKAGTTVGAEYIPIMCYLFESKTSPNTRVDNHYYTYISYNSKYKDVLDKHKLLPKPWNNYSMQYQEVTEYTEHPRNGNYWSGNDFDRWIYSHRVDVATD